jgi:hypothetical protein
MKSLSSDPKPMERVECMYSLLVKEMADYTFSQTDAHSLDMVEIYRWVMGNKVRTAGYILRRIIKIDWSNRLPLRHIISKSFNRVTPTAHPIELSTVIAKI